MCCLPGSSARWAPRTPTPGPELRDPSFRQDTEGCPQTQASLCLGGAPSPPRGPQCLPQQRAGLLDTHATASPS